jgi:hypothetical protein
MCRTPAWQQTCLNHRRLITQRTWYCPRTRALTQLKTCGPIREPGLRSAVSSPHSILRHFETCAWPIAKSRADRRSCLNAPHRCARGAIAQRSGQAPLFEMPRTKLGTADVEFRPYQTATLVPQRCASGHCFIPLPTQVGADEEYEVRPPKGGGPGFPLVQPTALNGMVRRLYA